MKKGWRYFNFVRKVFRYLQLCLFFSIPPEKFSAFPRKLSMIPEKSTLKPETIRTPIKIGGW